MSLRRGGSERERERERQRERENVPHIGHSRLASSSAFMDSKASFTSEPFLAHTTLHCTGCRCVCNMHLLGNLGHAPTMQKVKIFILKSLLRSFSIQNTIPSVLPVCSLHVHMKCDDPYYGGCGHTHSAADGVTYAVDVSERLGRSSSKEQYAFMYR